jgi:hypothetical protein
MVGEHLEDVVQRGGAARLEEERPNRATAARRQDANDDLPLGDEEALASDEITLADGGVALERRVSGVVEWDEACRHDQPSRVSRVTSSA